MSPEERQLLVDLFQRAGSMANQPRDRDAEAFIADAVRQQPYAPYLFAQTVIVQEQAMRAATERLQQLEDENRQLQARLSQGQPAPSGQGSFLGGLGSLFGGQQPQAAPPPAGAPRPDGPWSGAPQQPQGGAWNAPTRQAAPPAPQQGGAWASAPGAAEQPASGGGGNTFLKGALGAAAGVAGGALLYNAVSGMFHGNSGGGGLGLGSGLGSQASHGVGETVINNYYGDDSGRGYQQASGNGSDDDGDYQNADYDDDGGGDSDDSYDV